jgi:hypothetical protein
MNEAHQKDSLRSSRDRADYMASHGGVVMSMRSRPSANKSSMHLSRTKSTTPIRIVGP